MARGGAYLRIGSLGEDLRTLSNSETNQRSAGDDRR
jgi:hypothetical protein